MKYSKYVYSPFKSSLICIFSLNLVGKEVLLQLTKDLKRLYTYFSIRNGPLKPLAKLQGGKYRRFLS